MMDALRELYQEVILDHGRHPRNLRRPPAPTREARGHNPLCGDQLTVYLVLDEVGTVRDAAFEGRGCAISMASASLMTEVLKGLGEPEVRALFAHVHALATGAPLPVLPEELAEAAERLEVLAGVREYPVRVKCATLAWHTMAAALTHQAKATTE